MNIFLGSYFEDGVQPVLFADRDWRPMRAAVFWKQKKMKSRSAREHKAITEK